ncbi:hypothetical protein N7490_002540 [Penicillium lividum]|nr:hypothetical protein N7490_002540 [Penicillium lividum]
MICYCLGRPNSISEEDITIQLPNDEFITTMAKLTKIIRKSARVVYGSQERRLVNIWKASQVIQGDLTEFEASLPQRLKFTAQNGSLLCCQSVAHFFLGSVYYHTVLLQFRPLLIFHTSRRRNGDSTDNPAWLEGACMGAVEAARNLIRFISIAYLAMPITKDLRHNGFYIDAACFVLVLNMLGADEPDPEDLDLVRYGLNCLSQMLPKKTFKSNSSLLGVETPNSHDEEVQNMQLQSELDALAQGTFDSLDWDLMDPILGF